MDETSFIAQQLLDLRDRVDFEPFEIVLHDGRSLAVTHPARFSMLSGGILYRDQDNSYMIIPYESVLMLHTIFDT